MLNTYIKNRGITQTIVHNNNHNQFNEINWDADYDGNMANISVISNKDGQKQHYNISLDNQDLANILNVPSVNTPLHKRLQNDFENPMFRHDPNIYRINLPNNAIMQEVQEQEQEQEQEPFSLEQKPIRNRYLSSPLPDEELIVPITIDEKSLNNYTLTPRKHHKHKKTHRTYRVYKKHKSPSSKSKTKSKSSSKSKTKSSRRSSSYSLF